MATNHRQHHHRPADHPGTTPPRHRPCRKARLIVQPASHVTLDQAHEEAAVAALADLLATYVDAPAQKAA